MTINWKQSVIVVCDIAIATYLLLAVTAFNKPDAATSCSEVKIDIKAGRVEGFLNASEVKNILSKDKLYYQRISSTHYPKPWALSIPDRLRKPWKRVPL